MAPQALLLPKWPSLHLVSWAEWPQQMENMSGSAPQDLQDQNDELQAELEDLRAWLPQSWHSWPHSQSDRQLLPRHGRAGKSAFLGSGSGVLLLCAGAAGGNGHLSTSASLRSRQCSGRWAGFTTHQGLA